MASQCADFASRVYPIGWKLGKRQKQKGFLEVLGTGTLCFTDTTTGDNTIVHNVSLLNTNRKEITITGIAESEVQLPVTIYPKTHHDQLIRLLQGIAPQKDIATHKETQSDPGTATTGDGTTSIEAGAQIRMPASELFIKHHLEASGMHLHPHKRLSLVKRSRFLAIMKLITRNDTLGGAWSIIEGDSIQGKRFDIAVESTGDKLPKLSDTDVAEKVAALPFNVEAHKELLRECGLLDTQESPDNTGVTKITNLEKLQLGILDINMQETLSEMKDLYLPAYAILEAGEADKDQAQNTHKQAVEDIVSSIKTLFQPKQSIPVATPQDGSEVVRPTVQPRGVVPLSDYKPQPEHQQPTRTVLEQTLPSPAQSSRTACSGKKPQMSVFNATVEDIPDLTTRL